MSNVHFAIMPPGVCAPLAKGEVVKLRRKVAKQAAHMFEVGDTSKDLYKADLFKNLSRIFARAGEALDVLAGMMPDELAPEVEDERQRILDSQVDPEILRFEDDGGLAA